MPRLRFRLRTLMILVAVVSVLLGLTASLLRRRASFQRKAENYARKASQEYTNGMIAAQVPWFDGARPSKLQVRMQEEHNELGDYYAGLRVKYERAAVRPWLRVPPEPE